MVSARRIGEGPTMCTIRDIYAPVCASLNGQLVDYANEDEAACAYVSVRLSVRLSVCPSVFSCVFLRSTNFKIFFKLVNFTNFDFDFIVLQCYICVKTFKSIINVKM